MARRKPPGLTKRNDLWHIDKKIRGFGRLCESTDCSELEEAIEYLELRIAQVKQEVRTGRPSLIWRQAATKYLRENLDKSSIGKDAEHLAALDAFIGDLEINHVHDDTLADFVRSRRKAGRRTKTINLALEVVRRILNLSARSWRLSSGSYWLDTAPRITMQRLPKGRSDARKPYPLDWDEQKLLLRALPAHLARMALYKVNTGCRDAEVCGLRWEWEWQTDLQDLKGRIFLIPGDVELTSGSGVKNRDDRLVVLNNIAKSVVDSRRGEHPEFVFVFRGKPILKMTNSGWQRAWKEAGLPTNGIYLKGVHNLRHTCGRRLRAAGVPKETRSVLLGHRTADITTHYSVVEIQELLNAVNKLCVKNSRKSPALTIVKLRALKKERITA